MKKETRQKILLYASYAAFFSVCFVLFAYWTFPYDRLRDYIIQEAERPQGPDGTRRPSGLQLEIEELSPSWITGVDLTGVRLVKAPDTPGGTPLELAVDEASARISLLSLLAGDTAVSFEATVGGGTIEGEYEQSDEQTVIQAGMRAVDLGRLGVVRSLIDLPVTGAATGEVDLTIADDVRKTKGSIALTIAELRIGDGRAKLPIQGMSDGLSVERIGAGSLSVEIKVDNGVARFERFETDGPDLELRASGTVRLLRPLEMSRLDLLVRIKFTDDYRDRSDITRRLFSAMDFLPQLRAARAPDGALQYRISGSFGSRITPEPAGRAQLPAR